MPPATAWQDAVLAQVDGAIAGGCDFVQFRERGVEDSSYLEVIREAVRRSSATATHILVNDRADLAMAAGARGVHLPESGLPVKALRGLSPELLVGRSVHAGGHLALEADYLLAGNAFATVSKPGLRTALGVEGLRTIVAAAGTCPVWAVGGVTRDRVPLLQQSGIRGVAAIGAFIPPPGTTDVATAVQHLVQQLRFSFDSSASVP